MLRFNDIADRMLEYDPACDLSLLQRAYVFSAKMHDGQERLSGEPYLVHPLEVAGILADMRLDEVTVAAGLLHDAIEDTLTTADEIRRLFGEPVAFLVEGLTKIAKMEFTSARERQAENFRKMLIAMSEDIRILMIKLADRLHNMRTLEYMSEDSAQRIAQETLDIYAPLAHRLGIHWMKQELEELAFRALKPDAAAELERRLQSRRGDRQLYIEEVIDILSRRLGAANLEAEVTGRLKDLSSIHAKMQSQGISLDDVYDVIAFRIILVGSQEQVYSALGIVHSIWRPVPGRFKDYVALPKPNGYQSLHTTVIGPYGERMEIQLRTREMHENAEFGIAAHWKYKEGKVASNAPDDQKFAWLRQLVELNRELKDPHEFIDTVKVDLFPDEVFVFTPKGEVINLPRGATPVDFAYAIHSEVGSHCSGAKVNGKMVPLRHRLENGDTVEVQTSASQYPRKDWLEFVVSSRARNRIRHAIRAAESRERAQPGAGSRDPRARAAAGGALPGAAAGGRGARRGGAVGAARLGGRAAVGHRLRPAGGGGRRARSARRGAARHRAVAQATGSVPEASARYDGHPCGRPARRAGAFRPLLRAASRRRRGGFRHPRPRRDRARQGLLEGVPARPRPSHRRRVGAGRRRTLADPHAGALGRPAGTAGQGHQDHLRGGHQHRGGPRHHQRRPASRPHLRSVGERRGDAQRGDQGRRQDQGCPVGGAHAHVRSGRRASEPGVRHAPRTGR
jgi:ppGpp synthetase/RelA/SpoT-type nucleotidyltranferase